MKTLVAVDGSAYTKKALAWLMANQSFDAQTDELLVLNVQPPLPARARAMLGADVVRSYYEDEANKVLSPVQRFLRHHPLAFSCDTRVGNAAEEILRYAQKEKVHLICMGTHGRGALGRAVLGSVATKVVSEATVPVLLVK